MIAKEGYDRELCKGNIFRCGWRKYIKEMKDEAGCRCLHLLRGGWGRHIPLAEVSLDFVGVSYPYKS